MCVYDKEIVVILRRGGLILKLELQPTGIRRRSIAAALVMLRRDPALELPTGSNPLPLWCCDTEVSKSSCILAVKRRHQPPSKAMKENPETPKEMGCHNPATETPATSVMEHKGRILRRSGKEVPPEPPPDEQTPLPPSLRHQDHYKAPTVPEAV